MTQKIPEKVGRYVIDRLLGQGAMGAVYLGRDPQLDRKVAIKAVRDLDLDAQQKKNFLERFRNEARAAARLAHPSIVGVYDVGDEEGIGPFLVLEYVPGATLKHILRSRGALPPMEILSIAGQIAAAIDTAHGAQIIHRDVKPDNILVTEDGRAKLADFGIARVPDAALTKEGQFLGTPCYAAPETLSSGKYSTRSDLFSFAAVIYELVCGVRAFPGDDAISVAHSVVHDQPPPPSEAGNRDVPKGVDDVVMRGIAKDPEKRFASAVEMVDALDAAFVDAGVVEAGTSTLPSRPRRASGGAWVWAAVLLGGAALGIGLLYAFGAIPPFAGGEGEPDGGMLVVLGDDAGTAITRATSDASSDAAIDAGLAAIDAGIDSGPLTPDTGIAGMSRFEREDAAKDAIDRARALIEAGRLDDAGRELAHARELDPESSDLEELETRLGSLR